MSDEYDWALANLSSLVQKGIRQRLAVVVQPVGACDGPEADHVGVVSECYDACTREVSREKSVGPEGSVAMRPRLVAVARESMDEDNAT